MSSTTSAGGSAAISLNQVDLPTAFDHLGRLGHPSRRQLASQRLHRRHPRRAEEPRHRRPDRPMRLPRVVRQRRRQREPDPRQHPQRLHRQRRVRQYGVVRPERLRIQQHLARQRRIVDHPVPELLVVPRRTPRHRNQPGAAAVNAARSSRPAPGRDPPDHRDSGRRRQILEVALLGQIRLGRPRADHQSVDRQSREPAEPRRSARCGSASRGPSACTTTNANGVVRCAARSARLLPVSIQPDQEPAGAFDQHGVIRCPRGRR